MTSKDSKDTTKFIIKSTIKYIINTIIRMMMGMVFFFIIYIVSESNADTSIVLHIIFSLIGYQLLMMEAIMAYDSKNSWNRSIDVKTKRFIHVVLMITAFAFITAGFIIIISYKSTYFEGTQFTTTHGIFGLISFIFTVLNIISGIIRGLAFNERYENKFHYISKKLHTPIGTLSIILGLTTLILGTNKSMSVDHIGEPVATVISVFIGFSAFYVIVGPILKVFNEIRYPQTFS